MTKHLTSLAQLEKNLSTQLNIAGQSQSELTQEFGFNAEAQCTLSSHSTNFVGKALHLLIFHESIFAELVFSIKAHTFKYTHKLAAS